MLFVFSQLLNETSRNEETKARPQSSGRVGLWMLAASFGEGHQDQEPVSKQGRALTSLDTRGASVYLVLTGPVKPTLLQESFSFLRQVELTGHHRPLPLCWD